MYPSTIKYAIYLMIASVIFSLIAAYFNVAYAPAHLSKNVIIISIMVMLFIYIINFVLIVKRKNWARYVWLALYIIGLLSYSNAIEILKLQHIVVQINYYFQAILQLALTTLCFLPVTNAWFKSSNKKA